MSTVPSLPSGQMAPLAGRGAMFYREISGPPDAPTVILLHGLGATADLNWHCAYAALGRHFRVVALDHRGHGRGIRSERRFSLEDCADDVVALADHLGIDQFVPVGYSMGGPIAQLVWRRHPARVLGLVACATSRDFRGHPRERVLFAGLATLAGLPGLDLIGPAFRGIGRACGPLLGHPQARWAIDELNRNDPRSVLEAAAVLGRFSSREWVHDIDVPTAVIVTGRDRLVPPRRQQKLASEIPGALVYEVDDHHHVVAGDADGFVHALVGACRAVTQWPATPAPDRTSGRPSVARLGGDWPASKAA